MKQKAQLKRKPGKSKECDNVEIDTREMVTVWSGMIADEKIYARKKPYPKFSESEAVFLTRLIFHKEPKYVATAIADFLFKKMFDGTGFASGPSLRRIEFIRQFIINKGNATKAAISAGYSEKCAKQQGYRILRWVQAHSS